MRTEKGRKISNLIGKGSSVAFGALTGLSDPSGTVSNAAGQFAEEAIPGAIHASEKMMETAHVMYDTPADKYMQSHFLRDAEGHPITPEEGAKLAFGDGQKSKTLATQKSKKQVDKASKTKSKTLSKQQSASKGKLPTIKYKKKKSH